MTTVAYDPRAVLFGGRESRGTVSYDFTVKRWVDGCGLRPPAEVLMLDPFTFYEIGGAIIYIGDVEEDPSAVTDALHTIFLDGPTFVHEYAFGTIFDMTEPTSERIEIKWYRTTIKNRKGRAVPIEVHKLPARRSYGIGPHAIYVGGIDV